MAETVFTLPIATTPPGNITVKAPDSSTFVLTLTSPPDNRVTIPVLRAFHLALDILAQKNPQAVLIYTSGLPKFFSNGFDLDHLAANPNLEPDALLPVLRRLYTYPGPTIAVLNGHTFGAGVFLAMAADYRIMNGSRGFWCLPEVDIGLVIPAALIPLLRRCINDPKVWKRAAMEGHRFSGKEAFEVGIVDELGGLDEAFKLVQEKKLIQKSAMGAWKGLRMAGSVEIGQKYEEAGENISLRDGTSRVEEWKRTANKGKL